MVVAADRAEEIRRRYLAVDSSNVADVLDELGLPDQGLAPEFAPYPATAGRLAGWAFTIRGEMTPYPMDAGDPAKMEACAQLTPGTVSVWSGRGEGVCFFGELISIGMKERGCVGALVDGGSPRRRLDRRARLPRLRAVPDAGAVDRPLEGRRERRPRADARRDGPGGRSHTGRLILADSDGAIVVPAAVAEQVLERAEELQGREVQIRAELAGGLSLSEALAKFGHV